MYSMILVVWSFHNCWFWRRGAVLKFEFIHNPDDESVTDVDLNYGDGDNYA